MPNDPKWRTIARLSTQPISEVQAVFLQLMVSASTNPRRGHYQCTPEDISSALDIALQSVTNIISAMQGRVLDSDRLTGWEIRQPKREDNSAKRVKKWRERNVTKRNAPDKDKDKDKDKTIKAKTALPSVEEIYLAYPRKDAPVAGKKAIENAIKRIASEHDAQWLFDRTAKYAELRKGEDRKFTPLPATWFNRGSYEDEALDSASLKLQWVDGEGNPIQ